MDVFSFMVGLVVGAGLILTAIFVGFGKLPR